MARAPRGPYEAAAMAYLEAGWSPLPLGGPQGKTLLVKGWSGGHDNWPDRKQVAAWIREHPRANIGLRLPKHIIGIDMDCYDDKPGAATVADAEAEWGALPPTWSSTARTDGSGVRLYRVPEGLAWPGKLPQGGGVEIIQWTHRYVVVEPSVHHTGALYRWTSPTGGTEDFPEVGDV